MTLPSEHEFQPALTPEHTASLFLSPDMAEGFKTMPHGKPLTWGATPLNPYAGEDVRRQQFDAKKVLKKFFKHTPELEARGITAILAGYAHDINAGRVEHRFTRNYDSFQYRGILDDKQVPDWLRPSYEDVISGNSSPAEILAIADVLEIPTIELATLTHPFGERINYLKPMRDAVNQAIVYFDGELSDEAPVYEVRRHSKHDGLSTDEMPATLLMTRNTEVGQLPNGTRVIERSSFLLRLDLLPETLAQLVDDIEYNENWSEAIMNLPGFKEYVEDQLAFDLHDSAIPLSTTIFAANDVLMEKYLNEDHMALRAKEVTQKAFMEGAALLLAKELAN